MKISIKCNPFIKRLRHVVKAALSTFSRSDDKNISLIAGEAYRSPGMNWFPHHLSGIIPEAHGVMGMSAKKSMIRGVLKDFQSPFRCTSVDWFIKRSY